MKYVQVRRHAPKHAHGHLTDEGKMLAQEVKAKLPTYDLVISSNKPRAVETALLLTGKTPLVDARAGTPPFTTEQEKTLHELGETHPYGIAGLIFDNPEYRHMIKKQGQQLAEVIKETLKKLPDDGIALIISHDGVMVAAEKILKNMSFDQADKTFKPLEGFEVSETMEIRNINIIQPRRLNILS